jgi:hypothetical protein
MTTLSNQNYIRDEMKSRINSGNAIIQSKFFCLPISYKDLKIKIYKTVILSLVLYGYETWSLTLKEQIPSSEANT